MDKQRCIQQKKNTIKKTCTINSTNMKSTATALNEWFFRQFNVHKMHGNRQMHITAIHIVHIHTNTHTHETSNLNRKLKTQNNTSLNSAGIAACNAHDKLKRNVYFFSRSLVFFRYFIAGVHLSSHRLSFSI